LRIKKAIGIIAVLMMLTMTWQVASIGAEPVPFTTAQTDQSLSAVLETDATANTRVRVLHASPDAPAVDILVNGTAAFTDVEFNELTDYASLPFGFWNVTVVGAGTTSPAVIGPVVLDLDRYTDYTVVALNDLANIEPLVLVDDNAPVPVENAMVRFVHASPDAPAVDVAVQGGGPVLFNNIAFKGVGDYIEVAAGTYDLEVNVTGSNTNVLNLPATGLMGGMVYTVFATGFAGGGLHELSATVSTDAMPDTRIRVMHASPDAPAVDVLVNGTAAFTNLAFPDLGDYATLPYGPWNVTVVGAGTTGPAVIGPVVLDLMAYTDYTVLAVNNFSIIEPLVLVDDNTPVAVENARVRFVHASPNAPGVDIAVQGGGPILFNNIVFKGVGDYIEVAAGTYDLEVNVTGTNTNVLNLPGTELMGGMVYTVYATGFAGGSPALDASISLDAEPDTRVRVMHASPDAPAVDVLVDSSPAFSNLEFPDIADYATLPYGTYNVTVVPTGETGPGVIGPVDLNFMNDTDYTVMAVNTLASIEPLILMDMNGPISANKAWVRFVHASPDAPAVDIALAGGAVLFSDIEFKEVGTYLEVDAGTYDLEVRLTGTSTVVLDLPGLVFANGTVNTAYAIGFAAGKGIDSPVLGAVLNADATPDARVRVMHASPDAPAVDVLVNGTAAFTDIAYKDMTEYASLPYGAWEIEVVAAGTMGPAVIGPVVLDLANDTDYTVVALNTLENIEPIVLVDNNAMLDMDKAWVRFVHTSADAPAVDVALAGGAVLFSNVSFKEVATYIEVDAGTYDLEVRLAGTDTVVLDLPGLMFADGTVNTAFAVGLVNPPTTTTSPTTTTPTEPPAPIDPMLLGLVGVGILGLIVVIALARRR
jgi:hypothetical protein